MTVERIHTAGMSCASSVEIEHALGGIKVGYGVPSIYFVGTYKPMMCGIADYTSFLTRVSPTAKWGVISFAQENCATPLTTDKVASAERVWYGIPDSHGYSASVIQAGLKALGANNEDAILWFQHEFGIWPGNIHFVAMLKNTNTPKVVTFHTLHFQNSETPYGLRKHQYNLLRMLLPYVEAITVFSHGVYRAVTLAFPGYSKKVYIIQHGIHSYPEIHRLSRKEAKEKLNDFLLYESGLDQETKEALQKQRIFLDPNSVVLGQCGFTSPIKYSELLYPVRDSLQRILPQKRIVAVRIGSPRNESQKIYAEKLRRKQNGRDKFLLEIWLPQNILPVAQRAFDVNFYWPKNCTQSGLLAHALGVGAVIASRDLEGVGETLGEAGELVDKDLKRLLLKIQNLILNPELGERLEETVLKYAEEFSWEKQARRHYELAEHILHTMPIRSVPYSPSTIDTMVSSNL